jgi:hypothetical protein
MGFIWVYISNIYWVTLNICVHNKVLLVGLYGLLVAIYAQYIRVTHSLLSLRTIIMTKWADVKPDVYSVIHFTQKNFGKYIKWTQCGYYWVYGGY